MTTLTGDGADHPYALIDRYLALETEDNPTFVGSSVWEPFIDGISYFQVLREALQAAGPGDTVLISGLELEPEADLAGYRAGDPKHRPVVDLLAERAADGVDVRVILTGAVFAGSLPWPKIGPFRGNVFAARSMRGWLPKTRPEVRMPPLRDRVLLDWSGAGIGSNHQKLAILHIGGTLTAFVGGLDLVANRYDAKPHDRLQLKGERWGWHDGAVRITGPAAARVWENYRRRWQETVTLPRRYFYLPPGSLAVLNPPLSPTTLPPAPAAPSEQPSTDVAVKVMRTFSPWKIDEWLGLNRVRWTTLPRGGLREVHPTLMAAIAGARRYIYLEDQYFKEMPGGDPQLELYEPLRQAALRGVRVILVGSGRKDPADGGDGRLKRTFTRDLRHKVIAKLPPQARDNVMMYRVEHLTVHTKLMLVDDVFGCIGSANFYSRSMTGTDSELSCAVVSFGTAVRNLRVQLWAEHLRTPLTDQLREHLADLDSALGIWSPAWLPADADQRTWQVAGRPASFDPAERVLDPVRTRPRRTDRIPLAPDVGRR